jgi:hypothetical protein
MRRKDSRKKVLHWALRGRRKEGTLHKNGKNTLWEMVIWTKEMREEITAKNEDEKHMNG